MFAYFFAMYRVAVSTSYGFGIFDLVRLKMVYAAPVTVPSGKYVTFVWTR